MCAEKNEKSFGIYIEYFRGKMAAILRQIFLLYILLNRAGSTYVNHFMMKGSINEI